MSHVHSCEWLAASVQARHDANMSVLTKIAQITAPAVDLIYPPRCPLCGEAISQQIGVCSECWATLEFPSAPACSTCQIPFYSAYTPASAESGTQGSDTRVRQNSESADNQSADSEWGDRGNGDTGSGDSGNGDSGSGDSGSGDSGSGDSGNGDTGSGDSGNGSTGTGSIGKAPVASDILQCGACLSESPLHDGIAAGIIYNASSRQLILSYKHGRRLAMSSMMARLMAARLPQLEGDWTLIPVPLHPTRLWKRGFNQSALLARELRKITGHSLCVDALRRKKRTPSLGGLGAKKRARTLQGAIAANQRRKARIMGANIILVDDVLTTGATSDACIKALKRAGAKQVLITCFARVISEWSE